jgi:hypothetical protein
MGGDEEEGGMRKKNRKRTPTNMALGEKKAQKKPQNGAVRSERRGAEHKCTVLQKHSLTLREGGGGEEEDRLKTPHQQHHHL